MPTDDRTVLIHGTVASGFEEVYDVFLENFLLRGETGAACVAYYRGEKVVDLWGGYRDLGMGDPWREDTVVPVFSTSKGLASMALALAHSRGWLDYEAPVARYWPAFSAQGKEAISVRQLLAHQAGLCAIDIPISIEDMADEERIEAAIASQVPLWTPGSYHGYHSVSLGWYEAALLRHVDPQGRSLNTFFQEEIAKPLGLEFYFGLPDTLPSERIAHIETIRLWQMLFHLKKLPWPFVKAFLNPHSFSSRTIRNPKAFSDPSRINDRALMRLQVPAVTGVGQVRSIARAYGDLALSEDSGLFQPETLALLAAPPQLPTHGAFDLVLRMDTAYLLGFMKPFVAYPFGRSDTSFGSPGAGGSTGFADPRARLGFSYAPAKMDFYIFNDPRERALRDAVYRCIKRDPFWDW